MARTAKEKTTKKTSKKKIDKDMFPVQRPRGTHDILPQDQKYWEYVVETAKSIFRGFDFKRLDTPIFEETTLFTSGIGEETDIVSKEMYELKVRGSGPRYVLRPENTAAIIRAYIEHGMRSWPKPVKLFYVGPFFRYERPQKGRLRQFHQWGIEIIGSSAPITDVQWIYLTHLYFGQLGLEDYVVRINSLGEPDERAEYLKLLKDHYRRNRAKLCKNCKVRLGKNPLRLLDCKEEKCQQLANTAPRLLDHLSDASREHFENVLAGLDALSVPYEVAPSLVRGIDYYTHTVCEFVPTTTEDEEGSQTALAAGGRYNGLVKALGGRDRPAAGIAGGIERLVERLKEEGVELTMTDKPLVFVAQLGEQSKFEALTVMKSLQEAQIPFMESIDRDGMQVQLKKADRVGVPWAVIIGHKEVLDKTAILRNMESGMQEVVSREKLIPELQRRLHIDVSE